MPPRHLICALTRKASTGVGVAPVSVPVAQLRNRAGEELWPTGLRMNVEQPISPSMVARTNGRAHWRDFSTISSGRSPFRLGTVQYVVSV